MPEETIPAKHRMILAAVEEYGRPGDYSAVYAALPAIPPQTIRTVALKHGKGLGEPRKHPRPEVEENADSLDRIELLEAIAGPPSGPALAAGRVVTPPPEDPGEPERFVHPGPERELPAADRPFWRAMGESTRLLAERLGRLSPRWPEPPAAAPDARRCAVVGLADVHLGKLAWARETGHDYDTAIGERIFRNGVIDLCERINPYGVEEAVAPIGNDFFHYDNLIRTTTKGTLIDSDGRYPKVFHAGYEACCFAVELLRATAGRVRILHVPGNHDRLSSWHLCRELWLTFRNAPGVEIDMEPRTRKYHEYGANLFGFDHGDKVSERELPALMAFECRDILAGKTSLEWFIGHHHRSKRSRLLPEEDTFLGCAVNWIPSLCGADSFLFEQGYIKGGRAARAYLFDREHGREGFFEVRARES